MGVLRYVVFAVVSAAALLLAAMGVMLVWEALDDDPASDTSGGALVGVGGLLIVIALVVAWGAWATRRSGTRRQLLVLAVVGAFFALVPINLLIGPVGYALNVLCGAVAGLALLALLTRRPGKSGQRA